MYRKIKTAILYITKKYLYYDVYKTKDGRLGLLVVILMNMKIKLKQKNCLKSNLPPPLTIDISRMSLVFAKNEYPLPIYKIDGG